MYFVCSVKGWEEALFDEDGAQGEEVVEGVGFLLRVSQERRRVEGAHHEGALLVDELSVLTGDAELGVDEPLSGDPPEAHDDFRPQDADLFPEPLDADILFVRLRVPVLGRAALDDVRDVYPVLPVEPDGGEVFVEELTGGPDEGLALDILLVSGAFSYEQELRVGVSDPED